jgi:dihydroneopterin aldolase
MIGKIGIEKLSVMAIVGVFAYERNDKQELIVDLKVETDITACVASDSFRDALDYVALAKVCQTVASENAFHLIESYAAAVVRELSSRFPISWVKIKVLKPKALEPAAAFVEMEQFISKE